MTQAELQDKIVEIYDKVNECELKAKTLTKELVAIRELIEEIPENPIEIK